MNGAILPALRMTALRSALSAVAMSLALAVSGLAGASAAAAAGPAIYKTPQEAIDALVAAVKAGSTDGIVAVLGPEGEDLASSGDPVADRAARQRFEAAYEEAHELKQEGDGRAVLIIGKDAYPFPIPVVAEAGGWRFDVAAGAEEILDRRIGENELNAIKVINAIVDAQREYGETDWDGKGVQYARRLMSSAGKKDGLYWPTTDGADPSPLGPLVANARAEGYRRTSGATAPTPYHGYVYRVLVGQGKDAPGGARDYIVKGRMIGGFGLVAAPAEYGNSGVMTFVTNHDGIVFEKDLGPDTSAIAAAMKTFNPDGTWSKVEGD